MTNHAFKKSQATHRCVIAQEITSRIATRSQQSKAIAPFVTELFIKRENHEKSSRLKLGDNQEDNYVRPATNGSLEKETILATIMMMAWFTCFLLHNRSYYIMQPNPYKNVFPPNELPLLDPIKDLNVCDENFATMMERAESLAKRLSSHKLVTDFSEIFRAFCRNCAYFQSKLMLCDYNFLLLLAKNTNNKNTKDINPR